jgi:NitT/TauT family transport system substrate-binding protein
VLLPATCTQAAGNRPLRIALLPILDSFPFYVAEKKGYFNDSHVKVKAIPVGSGLERDQLMQAGEIDGMLNEIITSANFNRNKVQVKIVAVARKAYPDYPLFRILAAPGSSIDSIAKLSGQSIGISKNTIIEYVTDRLLAAENLPREQVEMKSIPVIPERFQLLMQSRIQAATLPDPLAKSAMVAGAGLIVDDSIHSQFSLSILTFSLQALDQRSEDVRRFLRAWDRAAADINADPDAYRNLLLEKIRVPKNVQQSFKIPVYPRKEVPNKTQWMDVMEWMVARGLLENRLAYEESITATFLP